MNPSFGGSLFESLGHGVVSYEGTRFLARPRAWMPSPAVLDPACITLRRESLSVGRGQSGVQMEACMCVCMCVREKGVSPGAHSSPQTGRSPLLPSFIH